MSLTAKTALMLRESSILHVNVSQQQMMFTASCLKNKWRMLNYRILSIADNRSTWRALRAYDPQPVTRTSEWVSVNKKLDLTIALWLVDLHQCMHNDSDTQVHITQHLTAKCCITKQLRLLRITHRVSNSLHHCSILCNVMSRVRQARHHTTNT